MTDQEAYEILYKPKEITYGMNFSEVIKAEEVAKIALEKQIPKPVDTDIRPNRYKEEVEWHWCPSCGCMVDEDDVYCSYCGQKLLWEKEND